MRGPRPSKAAPPLPEPTQSLASAELLQALDRRDRFVVVECPDGSAPKVRQYSQASDLLRALVSGEGEPKNVFVVVGTLLAITVPDKLRQRYLVHSDPQAAPLAVRIARVAGGTPLAFDPEQARLIRESIPLQEGGWLGDPALLNAEWGDVIPAPDDEEDEEDPPADDLSEYDGDDS